MTRLRLRNLVLPVGLALLAALLVGVYIVSYRNSVNHGAGLVKVLVASRDIPAGTTGKAVASGGYLETQTVPRRAVVPGSVTSAGPLASLITAGPVYQGEQITLRQFKPAEQGGIFAKFSGYDRAVVVSGDSNQLLAGLVSDGDRVDVVANIRYTVGQSQHGTTRVILRNLLVLKAPDATKSNSINGAAGTVAETLAMTDRQSQRMLWAMKNGTWFLTLRPTSHPQNSVPSAETLSSILTSGLSSRQAGRVLGSSPESLNAP